MKGGAWHGQTAVCIASGPSLTAQDCELVGASGAKVIAVNNSWQLAPFADVIYAGDYKWWAKYGKDITIKAVRWSCNARACAEFGLHRHHVAGPYNSGLRAIQLAHSLGAARILLVGYDCGFDGDRKHWHGDHAGLSNPTPARMRSWNIQFTRLAMLLKRTPILNCSRRTALRCFRRVDLKAALMEGRTHEHQGGAAGPAPDHPAQGSGAHEERGVLGAA